MSPTGRDKQCEHEKATLRGLLLKDRTLLNHPCGYDVHLLSSTVLHIPGKSEKMHYQLQVETEYFKQNKI